MIHVTDLETGESNLKTIKYCDNKYTVEEDAVRDAIKWYLWGTDDGHTW